MSSDIYVSFGGDTAGLEASLASAKASVSAFSRELATLAREQVKAGADAESALGQKMLAVGRELAEARERMAGFKESLKPEGGEAEGGFLAKMKEQLEGALGPLNSVRENLGEMVELVAAAFAVEKIGEWISETTEAAETFERMAAKLGVGVEQVQSLAAIAKLTGGDIDQMATQLERLQLSLAKTGARASPAAAALKVLGISLAEFRSASIAGQIDLMAEAFSRFADGSGKTAAAMALLGRTGADMIPFLDKGKEGLDELARASGDAGVIMSEKTIAAFVRTREDLNELSLAWTGLSQKIYALVNPAVDAAAKALTRLIESANPAALQGYLTTLATSLVGGAANVATFAVEAKAEWDKLVAAIAASVPTIVGDLQKIADGLNGLVASFKNSAQEQAQWASGYANLWHALGITSDETHAKAIAAAKSLYQSGEAGAAAFGGLDAAGARVSMRLSDIASGAETAKQKIAALLAEGAKQSELSRHGEGEGGLAGATSGAVKPQVPQMQIGGGDGGKAAKEALEAEISKLGELIDDYKELARAKEKSLDDALAHQRISVAQWLQGSKDALADERQDVEATYAAEIAAAAGNAAKIAEIHRKMAKDLAAIDQQVAEDTQKAADKTAQQWQAALSPIESAWNSQLRGLLSGTETWATAMKKIAGDLVIQMIESFEKLAVEKAALGLGNLFGQGPQGLLAGLGSALTGGAAGGAAAVATTANTTALTALTAAITALTGATTAEAAAGGAGAAAGGAGGLFSGLTSLVSLFGFAEGTDRIMQGGLAMVHSGETIKPARGSGPYTGRGDGGGNHTHNWGGVHIDTGGRDLDPDMLGAAMKKAIRGGHFRL